MPEKYNARPPVTSILRPRGWNLDRAMNYSVRGLNRFFVKIFTECLLNIFQCIYATAICLRLQSLLVTSWTARFTVHIFYFQPTRRIYAFCIISEQIGIISVYSINWLVFVTEKKYVYCAVRAESSNVAKVVCQDSSGQSPTFHRRVSGSIPGQSMWELRWKKVAQGLVFLLVVCFSLATIIPPTLYTRLLLHFAVTKRTKGETGEPSKNSALSDVGQQWIEMYFERVFKWFIPVVCEKYNKEYQRYQIVRSNTTLLFVDVEQTDYM